MGTAYKSGSLGASKTETALTGELGPELRVRGNEWTLVGENGAEFTDIRKGDVVFNHKQTESLLKMAMSLVEEKHMRQELALIRNILSLILMPHLNYPKLQRIFLPHQTNFRTISRKFLTGLKFE